MTLPPVDLRSEAVMVDRLSDDLEPTPEAAWERIVALRPADYARTRNAIDGAVSGLSPYLTHGIVSVPEVYAGVAARHPLDPQHKFVFELGWREYFRHVWAHRGDAILDSLHPGPLPDDAYERTMPVDIRTAATGVPAVDEAVRVLYATGTLHNHARMWLASYVVHLRKVHWRAGADWLYGHLLDGDLASNHLSWQWVAGTGSNKPYLFNAENVARYAPAAWHSPGSVIDVDYERLNELARRTETVAFGGVPAVSEPALLARPSESFGARAPESSDVEGREVWLLHPWQLGALPTGLSAGTRVIGVAVAEFHHAWPWNDRRWRFVGRRMAELADGCWYGDAATIGAALRRARRVRTFSEPHIAPWLPGWAECDGRPTLFPAVGRRCDSFSKWWSMASKRRAP